MPAGDRIPRRNVIATMKTYERAVQAVELHQKEQPPTAPVPDTKEFTADQLRELARALETTVPPLDDGLEIAYREAQHRLNKIRTSRLQRPLIGGFALAGLVGGIGVWAAWNHWIGAALVLLGIVALVRLAVRADEKGREQAMGALLKTEAQLVAQRKAMETAQRTVSAARTQLVDAGLPVDSVKLRDLADGLVLAAQQRQLEANWSERHEELQSGLAEAGNALADALRRASKRSPI
jgi:hypothetical protein